MQLKICSGRRAALTLIELVVVLVILAALAALVVPRLSGLTSQGETASNAAIVEEVNRAVQMFETRYGNHPMGWDSLLNTSDDLFTKLNPNVTQSGNATLPTLQVSELTALQASSLQAAGIAGLHDAVETRVCAPSDNSSAWRSVATGANIVTLAKTPVTEGHGDTFIDKAFSINQYKGNWNNEFVVVGLGGPTSLKGGSMSEVPLIQSADPTQYYARVMCVYMVPGTGTTATSFPAQYIGAFLPDGTSLRSNVDSFNAAKVTTN